MKIHQPYVAELDGLKGAAVLMIVAYSCYTVLVSFELLLPATGGLDYWLQAILKSGWVGLDLFMVVAGFLSTSELITEVSSASFYSRRWRRILPTYFLFLGLWLALAVAFKPEVVQFEDVTGWISVLTLTSNVLAAKEGLHRLPPHFVHLWSVALLAQFYLIWPLVIRVLGSKGRAFWICLGLIIALPLVRGAMVQSSDELSFWVLVTPFLRLDSFAWGAVLAMMGERMIRSPWVMVGGGLSMVTLLTYGLYMGGVTFQDYVVTSAGFTGIAVFGVSLLCMLLPYGGSRESRTNPIAFFLGMPLLQTFGKYSFTLYLAHMPVVLLFVFWAYLPGPGWSPFVIFYSLSLVVSLFLSVLSFHFWERRFIED